MWDDLVCSARLEYCLWSCFLRGTETWWTRLTSGKYGGQISANFIRFFTLHPSVVFAVWTWVLSCIQKGSRTLLVICCSKSNKENSNVHTYYFAWTYTSPPVIIPMTLVFLPLAKEADTICLSPPDFPTGWKHQESHFLLPGLLHYGTPVSGVKPAPVYDREFLHRNVRLPD